MGKDTMVILFISKDGFMSLREMHTKPTDAQSEIFMCVCEFQTAATICNRYNNEIAFKKM